MIITRTPFRISFFGGGSDYPAWFQRYGGFVLGATIDKYCYISCRYLPPFFDYRYRLVYSRVECVNEIHEIRHPAVRGVLQSFDIPKGLEIHHDGDLPARSGLGSSSAFTVGFVHALKGLQGLMISKKDLANTAIFVEQEILKEHVGCQDQILAAYGGFNTVEFHPDGTFDINPVILTKSRIEEFQSHMILFFTGFTRIASEIAKTHVDNLEQRKTEMQNMGKMAHEAVALLQDEKTPMSRFGTLLNEYWQNKRLLSERVTTAEIDEIYDAGIASGASGGKLLGAGGGGFILFVVKPEFRQRLKDRLNRLISVDFRLDFSGSKTVVYEPNNFQ